MNYFEHIQFLPLAYLLILSWVIVATLLAKVLSPALVNRTEGPLKQTLSKELWFSVGADSLPTHLFDRALLNTLNIRLCFEYFGEVTQLLNDYRLFCATRIQQNFLKEIYPEKYLSGCPPNFG